MSQDVSKRWEESKRSGLKVKMRRRADMVVGVWCFLVVVVFCAPSRAGRVWFMDFRSPNGVAAVEAAGGQCAAHDRAGGRWVMGIREDGGVSVSCVSSVILASARACSSQDNSCVAGVAGEVRRWGGG